MKNHSTARIRAKKYGNKRFTARVIISPSISLHETMSIQRISIETRQHYVDLHNLRAANIEKLISALYKYNP
jgi:hypothetical protein